MILFIFRFGFEGWISVLISSAPDLCILFTSDNNTNDSNVMINRGFGDFTESMNSSKNTYHI